MILRYSSTEFIRFNANMAFLSMSRQILLRRTGLGGTSDSLFSFLLSLLQYMPAHRLVPLNTFEITFLGSGVGVD